MVYLSMAFYRKLFSWLILGSSSLLQITSIAKADTLIFATAYDDRAPQTIVLKAFSQDIQRLTNNEITFDIHTNAALYPETDILPAVAAGDAAMGEVILSSLADFDPIFMVDNIPFLVGDFDQARDLWQASQEILTDRLSELGVTLLYSMPWAPQALYTDQEIIHASQLNGTDIRSYSPITEQLISGLNANPVTVPYTNIREAFENNTIEAMITSPTAGVRSEAYLFTSHYTDINAWIPKNIVFINSDLFNQMPPETRQAILSAAQKAENRGWGITRNDYFRSRITLSDNGIKVRTPSVQLMNELRQAAEPILRNWLSQTQPSGQVIIDRYFSLLSDNANER